MKSEVVKYHISKHRYYELKHFCLQYNDWKKKLLAMSYTNSGLVAAPKSQSIYSRTTEDIAIFREELLAAVDLIDSTAALVNPIFSKDIVYAVTNNKSYDVISAGKNLNCTRVDWYGMYRKFFYILDRRHKLI